LHERLGVPVVYVIHDQGEALTMSARSAGFNDGRIQQLAPPEDLYERPENHLVASLIGANNTQQGTVTTTTGSVCTVRLPTGEILDAVPINVSSPGERTTGSIRPERVEFKPEDIPPGAHTIEAEVLEFIYMGDIFRKRMRVAGNDN